MSHLPEHTEVIHIPFLFGAPLPNPSGHGMRRDSGGYKSSGRVGDEH